MKHGQKFKKMCDTWFGSILPPGEFITQYTETLK